VCAEDDDNSGGMGNLNFGVGGSNGQSYSDAQSRTRSGVVDVDIRDIELEVDKKAQGGLGVLYKGVWRGCEVAVKAQIRKVPFIVTTYGKYTRVLNLQNFSPRDR
jgi:hypothetical protein